MANSTLTHQTFFANRYGETETGMRDLPAGEYYIELIDEVVDAKALEEQLSTYEYSLALMTDIDGWMDITRFTIPRPTNDEQEAAMEKVSGKRRYMRLGAIVDNRETIDFYFTNDPAGI